MTPVAITDTPMDLSTKTRRKLRLEEFLRQNLDQAPARRVIQWVDRERGIFRILWTHQSSGAFTQEDAALFRYWALARGKQASLSSVELKQSLRMALNKSPSVERLSATHDEYRYFKFTEWGSRGSPAGGHKTHKTPEGARRILPSTKPPPLVPINVCKESSSCLGDWPSHNSHLTKNEGSRVVASKESHSGLPIFPCASPMFSWPGGEHRLGGVMGDHNIPGEQVENPLRGKLWEDHPMNELIMTDQFARESHHAEHSMRVHLPEKELLRQQLTSQKVLRDRSMGDRSLGEHMFGDRSLGDHMFGDRSLGDHMFGDRSLGDHMFGDRSLGDHMFGDRSLGDHMFGDRSLGDHMYGDRSVDHMFDKHLVYAPETRTPQACVETTESYQLVPSIKDYYHRLECGNVLSLYSDAGSSPKRQSHYDYRSTGNKFAYHSSNDGSVPLKRDFYEHFKSHYFDVSLN